MRSIKGTLLSISEKITPLKNSKYINSGGCAYFAYLIAEQLSKRNIKYKIVISDYLDYESRQNILKPDGLTSGVNHVLIKAGGIYFDSEGEQDMSIYRKYYKHLFGWTPEEALAFYKKNKWNQTFKDSITPYLMRKIKYIINEEFKRYDEAKRTKNRSRPR